MPFKCKCCNKDFEQWVHEYNCTNCQNGYDDADWDDEIVCETGLKNCHYCQGSGIEKRIQFMFCCEECMIEYWDENEPF